MPDARPQAPTAPAQPPAQAPAPASPAAPAQPAAPAPASPSAAPGTAPAPTAPPPAQPAAPESVLAPKPGEPAKPAATPPPERPRGEDGKFLPIEVKIPEGAKVDPGTLESFKTLAKEHGLNSKQAQALVDFQVNSAAAQDKAYAETLQRARVADLERLKGDPEYGGAFYEQTRQNARSILERTKYGPAVSKKLEQYGLDCDPDFVKLFAEFRSLVAEDSTSSRLTTPTPAPNGAAPLSQTARQAATYKQQPG